MINNPRSILDKLTLNPKIIFLMDSLGAMLTAILLFGVLARFEEVFGMPSTALYFLSAAALGCAAFSFYCFLFVNRSFCQFLRIIGTANLLYCVLTVALIIINFESVTKFGLAYFALELAVIAILMVVEFKAASDQ